jgi:hypothetical protein
VQRVTELEHEINFLEQRKELSRGAINALLRDEEHEEEALSPEDALPKIAFVFSGGGYRAMIETIGFLRGAEKVGILDCASYMMGLSGSTWAINPLVVSGESVDDFAANQGEKVGRYAYITDSIRPLMYEAYEHKEYRKNRFIEERFGQDTGIIGSYGHGIAWALLQDYNIEGRKSHDIRLSDLATPLQRQRYPLPISVAVHDPGKESDGSDRVWYEFSPFYVGTMYQKKGSWIRPQYFGHLSIDGKVMHRTPEYPLAYLFGIFGSAFALSAEDAKKWDPITGLAAGAVGLGASLVSGVYKSIIPGEREGEPTSERINSAVIPNFNYGRTDLSPVLTTSTHLMLVDGGITKQDEYRHNFASVPALWRDVDVIIMCDSVSKPNTDFDSKHLMASAQEAARLGYAFPTITKEDQARIQNEVATLIAKDTGPVVVYMKAKKHAGYGDFDPDETVSKFTATRNFDYKINQYNDLVGLTDTIMRDEKTVATIKESIREAIRRRK